VDICEVRKPVERVDAMYAAKMELYDAAIMISIIFKLCCRKGIRQREEYKNEGGRGSHPTSKLSA
jgi:hypothetical protein